MSTRDPCGLCWWCVGHCSTDTLFTAHCMPQEHDDSPPTLTRAHSNTMSMSMFRGGNVMSKECASGTLRTVARVSKQGPCVSKRLKHTIGIHPLAFPGGKRAKDDKMIGSLPCNFQRRQLPYCLTSPAISVWPNSAAWTGDYAQNPFSPF